MRKTVRAAAKAIIIEDRAILCLVKQGTNGIYFTLPGGGQNHGETMKEALIRECEEEINAEIEIGKVLFVREYIGKNHEMKHKDKDFHQVEIMFQCQLKNGHATLGNGSNPDHNQTGVQWLEMDKLGHYRFYPKQLIHYLQEDREQHPIYVGDMN